MRKKRFVEEILRQEIGSYTEVYGWIVSVRENKTERFLVVEDSTARINVRVTELNFAHKLKREQAVYLCGKLTIDNKHNIQLDADSGEILGTCDILFSPHARETFDVLSPRYSDYVENNKHIYIRNEKYQYILKARYLTLEAVRSWFRENGYFEVTAPILTPILLYEPETGINVKINKNEVYLTQCVGFYLESAVHSLEKVYNVGPSFRAAESVSKRHLMEYWHIKSELAFCTLEDYFDETESLIAYVVNYLRAHGGRELSERINKQFCDDGANIPFKRIEYTEAINILQMHGFQIQFGKSLGEGAEKFLADYFGGPFWVLHNPRNIEGFPYKINRNDSRLTETADLIASNGMGELLGIAEKITSSDELINRLKEKGKNVDDYEWFLELRQYGTMPHCGMGMGLERLIRWIFSLDHVKDAIPFPRRINKRVYP